MDQASVLETLVLMAAATRSLNFALQPRFRYGEHLVQTPILQEVHDKVKPTLSCLGGHVQTKGDIEHSPVVRGEQATMVKTTQRFTTLAELGAEGLTSC